MKILPKSKEALSSPFAAAFRALPVPAPKKKEASSSVPCLRSLIGKTTARILVIGPHPTPNEMTNGIPFSDNQSAFFYDSLRDALGLKDDDFLLMHCSYFGNKASAASTKEVLPFLQRNLQHLTRLKLIVCAGMEPFSYVFAGGRKTHARTMIGNLMYLPHANNLPVFVLPDPSRMFPVNEENWKDVNFAKENREAFVLLLDKLAARFSSL